MSSMVTTHERPGVYSVYAASAVVSGAARRGWAAVAARSQGGPPGKLYDLGRYEEAETTFGKEDALTALVKLLMANGAARVLAVPGKRRRTIRRPLRCWENRSRSRWWSATARRCLSSRRCGRVLADAQVRRERIAVVPGGAEESVSQLVARQGTQQRAGGAGGTGDIGRGRRCAGGGGGGRGHLWRGETRLPWRRGAAGIPGLALRYGEELDTLLQGCDPGGAGGRRVRWSAA
ncbi:MAG: hypothetical protein ACLS43_06580 [Evtepia gabavorous]